MKKIMILMGVVCLFATGSCKKGDEDPALSLLTRKARLTGVWDLTELESTTIDNTVGNSLLVTSSDGKIENSYQTFVDYPTDSNITKLLIEKHELTINKDGTWSEVYSYQYEMRYYFSDGNEEITGNANITSNGNWTFGEKVKGEYKNKERLIFEELFYREEFTNRHYKAEYYGSIPTLYDYVSPDLIKINESSFGETIIIHDLLRLSSKEMIWQEISNSYYSSESGSTLNENESSFQEKITWTKR